MLSGNDQNGKIPRCFLPRDTKEYLPHAKDIDNLYLSLFRLSVRVFPDKGGKEERYQPYGYPRDGRLSAAPNQRQLLSMLDSRQSAVAASLPKAIGFQYTPSDKVAVGIGANSPFDTILLLTLHPVYGIPYIPGSAVKGVVRNCWIQEEFHGSEKDALADVTFAHLFGTDSDRQEDIASKKARGALVFFDSYPQKDFLLVFDVHTPHFKGYYDKRGKTEPTDDSNPVPISFPVLKNTSFKIVIGCTDAKSAGPLLSAVKPFVEKAFREYGIGAKTSLGFGWGELIQLKLT